MNKLYILRPKNRGKGKAAQLRAASGRMITDLEMHSTYRGAVEIFNLCRNLHPHDALFAECIRIFNSCTIDGQAWLWRLHVSQGSHAINQQSFQTYIPPTQTLHVRSDRSKANEFEAYG